MNRELMSVEYRQGFINIKHFSSEEARHGLRRSFPLMPILDVQGFAEL